MDRLTKLGTWMQLNGEGIRGTRPNAALAQTKITTSEEVRFTRKGDRTLYAFVFQRPATGVVEIPGLAAAPSQVELLGHQGGPLRHQVRASGNILSVALPASNPDTATAAPAFGLKITFA